MTASIVKWKRDLGNNIRARRMQYEMTLTRLSEKSGVNISYLSDVEDGFVSPSYKVVSKIAHVFSCHPNELYPPQPSGQEAP